MTANFIAAIHKYRSQTHRIIIQQLRWGIGTTLICQLFPSLTHSYVCNVQHYFFHFDIFLLCLHGAEAMNEFCWQISSSKYKVYNDFIIIGYKTSTKLSLCMSPAVPFLSTFFSFTCMHTSLVHIVCLVMSFGMEICLSFFK